MKKKPVINIIYNLLTVLIAIKRTRKYKEIHNRQPTAGISVSYKYYLLINKQKTDDPYDPLKVNENYHKKPTLPMKK